MSRRPRVCADRACRRRPRFATARRALSLILLSAGFSSPTALAQGAPVTGTALVTASPNPSSATVGTSVIVTLRVGLAGVWGMSPAGSNTPAVLGGYQITISFDKTRLRFESASGGTSPGFTSTPIFSAPATANAEGKVTLVASQTTPDAPTGEVTVALLSFTTLASGPASLSPNTLSVVSALQPGPPSVGPASIPSAGSNTNVTIFDGTPTPTPLPGPALQFFSLAPCRLVDTRTSTPPPLSGGTSRTFPAAGLCGIPPTAKALAVNVTATLPTVGGDLRLYPAASPLPLASAISYRIGQTRAAQTLVGLNGDGDFSVRCDQPGGSTVHVILDVAGYFE
jgi:hypothetical protein